MREDFKKGNCRPHLLPEPLHHLGVGVIVEAGLGIVVVAGCLIILVGGDVRNRVLAVGLLGSGAGGWWQGRAGMGRALELRFEHSG